MLRQELLRAGVPESAVTRELWSLSTHENAIFSAELLRRLGARRIAVVTCEWHVARAIANFQAMGIDAWPLPSVGIRRGIVGRVYRFGHERICTWLDARAIQRADAFTRVLRTNSSHEQKGEEIAE